MSGSNRAGGRKPAKKDARKTAAATAATAEERGALFGMREKENEGEFESGKTVGRDCDQSHLLHCPGN